ncbi:MAG: sensor domain-containing diguanylate cyclase [Spirochaetales bacterium]|nr:MAG: sensor domain-containing diguanylate cyclase [Spirochaetales bacterium]
MVGSAVDTLKGRCIPAGRGIAGWIAEHGQAVIIEDVTRDSRFDPTMDQISNFTTESIIGVPLKTKNKVFGVIELINKLNGSTFTALEFKTLLTIADFAAIAIEKAYYFKALKRIATVDPLTGVLNRRSMIRILEHEKERSIRHKTMLSLLVIDIDKFKAINDDSGHLAGDDVLKALTSLLLACVRKVDSVCRYGGDEFVVILPETGKEAAEEVRQRIMSRLSDYNREASLPFTVSIGAYASAPDNLDDLFAKADMDLYREKIEKDTAYIDNLSEHLEDFFDEENI